MFSLGDPKRQEYLKTVLYIKTLLKGLPILTDILIDDALKADNRSMIDHINNFNDAVYEFEAILNSASRWGETPEQFWPDKEFRR